ncbi:hypothetical protein [Shinella sp.]|uniref:hypothetical protein n=1 Tax=Shinella sp. TaxID=1870904 RepID=UPI003F728531
MPQAPPHYHDRVFEFSDICRALDVNAASLTNWLVIVKTLRRFGDKRGHRRVYSQHEVFVIALLVSLHHAGVSVNGDAIATILSATYNPDPLIPEPGSLLTVRQTDTAGIVLHAATIWQDIATNLKEIEIG